MKAISYFLQLLSVSPEWTIIGIIILGAYAIISLAMVLLSNEVDTIRITPWSFTLQKKKEALPTPTRYSPKNNITPSKRKLPGQQNRPKKLPRPSQK